MHEDESLYPIVGAQSLPWLRKRSVAIMIRRPAEAIGTALVVALADRIFLATVAHNFTGVGEAFDRADIEVVSVASANAVTLRVPEWSILPTRQELSQERIGPRRDLAWAEIHPGEVQKAGLRGATVGELLPGAVLSEDKLYAATGMQWESRETSAEAGAILDSRGVRMTNNVTEFTFHTRFTNPAPPREEEDEFAFIYGSMTVDSEGDRAAGRRANGMSGGGVWEVQLRGSPEQPRNIHRLVALIRAVRGERILAIPVERWLSFLVSENPELRESMPS